LLSPAADRTGAVPRSASRRRVLAWLGGGAAGLALAAGARRSAAAASPRRDFAVYYAAADDPALADFDLLVLDSDAHPPLAAIAERAARRPTVLGYLALAEVDGGRSHEGWVRQRGLLLGNNPDWPGASYIDLRAASWHRHVVEVLVPRILAAGFDGVFLDTLDDAEEHERRDAKRFKGMKTAAIALVRAIRARFPGARLMMNRGFALLPALAGSLDMALGESLLATYDFAAGTHGWAPDGDYREAVALLHGARRRHPELTLYTLDYCDPADGAAIARIYATQRANGFLPYAATIALDRIVDGPTA
jgi:uncharacterized protein (TIGR01370 family)